MVTPTATSMTAPVSKPSHGRGRRRRVVLSPPARGARVSRGASCVVCLCSIVWSPSSPHRGIVSLWHGLPTHLPMQDVGAREVGAQPSPALCSGDARCARPLHRHKAKSVLVPACFFEEIVLLYVTGKEGDSTACLPLRHRLTGKPPCESSSWEICGGKNDFHGSEMPAPSSPWSAIPSRTSWVLLDVPGVVESDRQDGATLVALASNVAPPVKLA